MPPENICHTGFADFSLHPITPINTCFHSISSHCPCVVTIFFWLYGPSPSPPLPTPPTPHHTLPQTSCLIPNLKSPSLLNLNLLQSIEGARTSGGVAHGIRCEATNKDLKHRMSEVIISIYCNGGGYRFYQVSTLLLILFMS